MDGDALAFSVVVPAYGRPRQLAACLEALAAQDDPGGGFEAIVIDDGSPVSLKPTVDALRSGLRLQYLRQANRGPAAARNAGAALARGRYLAFTDDDCAPDPTWLAAFAARLGRAPNHLLGGRTVNALGANRCADASQELLDYLEAYFPRSAQLRPFFTSNNIAAPRDRFLEIGGFDQGFPLAAGEDREFCDRWHGRGWPSARVGDAVVRHAHALSLAGFWRQHLNYGRGAVHYQRAARAGRPPLRPEPPRFYAGLLAHPFRHHPAGEALLRAGLIAVSQIATASGFALEHARARPDVRTAGRRS